MKLSGVSVDPVRVEQGEWFGEQYGSPIPEMGDLCVKVRGTGNADWRRAQAKLVAALPRNKRLGNQIDPDENDRITSILLLEHSLIDWSGIDDEAGVAIPYSKEQAKEILTNPAHRRVRDAIFIAANMVGENTAAKKDDLAKN